MPKPADESMERMLNHRAGLKLGLEKTFTWERFQVIFPP